jgi:hypothetical protein
VNLFKALKEPKFVPFKQALDLAAHTLNRLFQNEEKNESAEILQKLIIVENQKVLTMQEELDLILKQAEDPRKESDDFSKLKQEFLLSRNSGKRTNNLEDLFKAVSTVKPTSNERTF